MLALARASALGPWARFVVLGTWGGCSQSLLRAQRRGAEGNDGGKGMIYMYDEDSGLVATIEDGNELALRIKATMEILGWEEIPPDAGERLIQDMRESSEKD